MLKKLLLPLLVFCISGKIFCQSTDTISTYIDYDEKIVNKEKASHYLKLYKKEKTALLWQRDKYYIFGNHIFSKGQSKDSLGLIKQGYFEVYYFDGGAKSSSGNYDNNEKTGEWKYFDVKGNKHAVYNYYNGKMIGSNLSWYDNGKIEDSIMLDNKGNGAAKGYHKNGNLEYEGNYQAGSKKDKWTYYYEIPAGQKSMEVVFDKDSAISVVCYKENGDIQKKECAYEIEAEFKRGQAGWVKYLISKLSSFDTYKYLGSRKKYTAVIRFAINTEGETTDISVEEPRMKALDDYAVEVIRNSPEWKPAIQHNKKVKAYRRQPITFVTE